MLKKEAGPHETFRVHSVDLPNLWKHLMILLRNNTVTSITPAYVHSWPAIPDPRFLSAATNAA